MRRSTFGVTVLMALAVPVLTTWTPAAHADQYKWCAFYGDGPGGNGTNCGFITYKQCLDTISGIGGTCGPNPWYTGSGSSRHHKRAHNGD